MKKNILNEIASWFADRVMAGASEEVGSMDECQIDGRRIIISKSDYNEFACYLDDNFLPDFYLNGCDTDEAAIAAVIVRAL